MRVKLLIAISIMLVGCAAKPQEVKQPVQMTDIMIKTQGLIESRKIKQLADGNEQVDSKIVQGISKAIEKDGAKLEVKAGVLILWLPERLVFEFDDSSVEQQKTIQALASFMQIESNLMLRIIGHTDAVGDDGYNHKLGMRRAAAVAKQLIGAGVPAEKLILSSKGSEMLKVLTSDREVKNRRVELLLPSSGINTGL